MLLSILIPSTIDRQPMLDKLVAYLQQQIIDCNAEIYVEIKTSVDNRQMKTGSKRNLLLNSCSGEYVVFIDSDDWVSEDYIKLIMEGILSEPEPDVVAFNGWIETNGRNRQQWFISKDLKWETKHDAQGNIYYNRFPHHLIPTKREIALQIGYPDVTIGEDSDYSARLAQSGLIKTEYKINKDLYFYHFSTNK